MMLLNDDKHLTWSTTSLDTVGSQSVNKSQQPSNQSEELRLNSSETRRKNKGRRQRPRLEWYQQCYEQMVTAKLQRYADDPKCRLQAQAKAVVEIITDTNDRLQEEALRAYSAVDMNTDGTILTFSSTIRGPDAKAGLEAHEEEIVQLIKQGCGTFMRRSNVPKEKIVTYYNPQVKIKMKNGKLVKWVRRTIGGDHFPYAGPTSAQVTALETIRLLLNAIVSEGVHWH